MSQIKVLNDRLTNACRKLPETHGSQRGDNQSKCCDVCNDSQAGSPSSQQSDREVQSESLNSNNFNTDRYRIKNQCVILLQSVHWLV